MRNVEVWFMALAVASTLSLFTTRAIADTNSSTYHRIESISNVQKGGDIGVGMIIGSPTGVDLTYWDSEITSVKGGIAFNSGNMGIIGDYVWHWRDAFTGANSDDLTTLVPYLGGGLTLAIPSGNQGTNYFGRSDQNLCIGVRLPIGIEFLPRNVPIGVFAEIDPGIGFIPDVFSFVQGGAGARYYF